MTLAAQIYTQILADFPSIRDRDISVIQSWLDDGASLFYHIQPVLKVMKERGVKPESFGYFTFAIEKQREKTEWYKHHGIFHPEHNARGETVSERK